LFGKLANAHPNLLAIKLDGATKELFVWGLRCGFITYGPGRKERKGLVVMGLRPWSMSRDYHPRKGTERKEVPGHTMPSPSAPGGSDKAGLVNKRVQQVNPCEDRMCGWKRTERCDAGPPGEPALPSRRSVFPYLASTSPSATVRRTGFRLTGSPRDELARCGMGMCRYCF